MKRNLCQGWKWRKRAPMLGCAVVAGLLTLLATTLNGQPVPNVVVWGTDYTASGGPMPPAPDDATNIVLVSDGDLNSLALRADGTVVAWGDDSYGQTDVPSGLTNVVAVAAAGGLSMALKADGTVAEWGWDGGGIGSVPAAAGLTNAVAISGYGLCLALRSDQTPAAWSPHPDPPYWSWFVPYTSFIVTTYTNSIPPFYHTILTNVPPTLTNAVAVAAGPDHCLALRSDGTVVAWGSAIEGQTNIPPGLTNVVAIATGSYFSMALKADGTVAAWGGRVASLYGCTNVPADLTNAVAIAMGVVHGLALRSDGTVAAWGDDTYGQTDVPPGLTNVVSIAAGGYSSMAVIGAALPPSRAALTNPTFAAGHFSVQVPTDCGRVYALEYKNSLADAKWQALGLAAGTGGLVQLVDPAPSAAQRFYRVRRW